MSRAMRWIWIAAALWHLPVGRAISAESGPYHQGRFQGRIAYSCDGNHNDPDDWISSPMTLAILAESGVKDRLARFADGAGVVACRCQGKEVSARPCKGLSLLAPPTDTKHGTVAKPTPRNRP